jgi:hypothetical protein
MPSSSDKLEIGQYWRRKDDPTRPSGLPPRLYVVTGVTMDGWVRYQSLMGAHDDFALHMSRTVENFLRNFDRDQDEEPPF